MPSTRPGPDVALATRRRVLPLLARVHPRLAGPWAFDLFCATPPRVEPRGVERTVHDQAVTATLAHRGAALATYTWGSADRRILLCHGRSGRASNFATLVVLLVSAGFEVHAFDAPGHGGSSGDAVPVDQWADVVVAVATECGPLEGVVGHSFGGLAVMNALRRGLTAPRVVTIATPCRFDSLPVEFARTWGLPAGSVTDLRRRCERLLADEPDIWQTFSADHRVDELDVDLYVVHDRDDCEVPVAEGRTLAAAFGPRATTLLTSGLGHRRILRDRTVLGTTVAFLDRGPR